MLEEPIKYMQKDEPRGGPAKYIPFLEANPDGTFKPLNMKKEVEGTSS